MKIISIVLLFLPYYLTIAQSTTRTTPTDSILYIVINDQIMYFEERKNTDSLLHYYRQEAQLCKKYDRLACSIYGYISMHLLYFLSHQKKQLVIWIVL